MIMKKLLLLMFVTFGLSAAYGQYINVNHFVPNGGLPICDGNVTIWGQYQFPAPLSSFTITVDWQDGTTTDTTFFSETSFFQIEFNHAYATTGTNTASYTVYSDYMAADVVTDVPLEFLIGNSSSCGFVPFAYIYQQTPFVVYSNAPLDFVGSDGSTITISPINSSDSSNGVYSGLNPSLAPYTVSVNDSWLLSKGLMQVTADQIIPGFESYGAAIVTSNELIFELDCATAETDPDVVVNHGWVFNFVAPLEAGFLIFNFCNYACQNTTDATVTIEFPADFVPNTSGLTNASFVAPVLTFDLEDLGNCESVTIPCTFPGITPAGTQICFPVSITAANDTDLSNNVDTICGIVFNSYDPNDKQVNHPATIDPDTQEKFVYQIRFQNDGNFPAVNVVVRDTMSTNLDISTFKLLETSHPVAASVNPTTREVTFTFNAIWLESSDVDLEASQGYILYEIDEAAGLSEGDAIENTAYIFFDFNDAIITNTTVNTNNYPVGLAENESKKLTLYPNPAATNIKFSGDQVQKVIVYDLLGQVVMNKNVQNNSLSIAQLNNGVYFVEMHTASGAQTLRVVVRK
jgi:uncharacterized repeat protein (TIGR01451 family)